TPYWVRSSRIRAISCSGYREGVVENIILGSTSTSLNLRCRQIADNRVLSNFVYHNFVRLMGFRRVELDRLIDVPVLLFHGLVIGRNPDREPVVLWVRLSQFHHYVRNPAWRLGFGDGELRVIPLAKFAQRL